VTVIKDAAGRYFASFVVETDPGAEAARFAPADAEVGIDLGLTAFAVLSDGTVVKAPKFLRRAERKLKRAQRSHGRKAKGSTSKVPGVRHCPRPGRERSQERARPGTQGEDKCLWRRCKTRDGPRSR